MRSVWKLSLIVVVLSIVCPAFARTPLPLVLAGQEVVSQQDHAYTIEFTHSGKANIIARYLFNNLDTYSQNRFVLRLPDITVSDVTAYQVSANAQIVRATAWSTQNNIRIELPYPIATGKQGQVVLVFSATGYTQLHAWGIYSFDFKPLRVSDQVTQLHARVGVENGLYSENNSYSSDVDISRIVTLLESDTNGYVSGELSNALEEIGLGGDTIYMRPDQAPEAFVVSGKYADAQYKFSLGSILIAIAILALLTVVALLIFYRNSLVNFISLPFVIGFAVSLVFIGYSLLVFALDNSNSVILVAISVIVYTLLLVVPGTVMGIQRGFKAGFIVTITTVLLLGMCLALYWVLQYKSESIPVYSDHMPELILPLAPLLRLM